MRLRSRASQVVLGIGLALSLATMAEAQASRTWVSGVGDDANPCSRTAPCKTFAGAISKTAAGGYIHVIDPGGFGAVTITKSITIDGAGQMAGVLGSLVNGIVINGSGIKVVLRNLDLEGFGNGLNAVHIVNAGSVHVEKCNILNWSGNGVNAASAGAAPQVIVSDSSIRHTANGIAATNARVTVDGVRFDNNGKGVLGNANSTITVRDSHAAGGTEGFTVNAATAIMNIENSISTNNTFGVDASAGGIIRLSNSGILSNSNTGLFNDGGSQIISLSGNSVQGNPTPGAFTSTILKQ